ncbi:protein FAM221B isoform X2 [Callorhinchus milii]|uniref:protein FAM221B isoform X2 n=1 Tax=Callorhinchus milii TaxID=7868 RepID=UPI0004575E5D|nr:protein FAM221B isoform X2 [Callorhinchus milii]|eukprot:gi/632958976/ref/XP_007895355.1/ PREDICTED: protein FAM221B isoform X2 [Callorhinchus milii]
MSAGRGGGKRTEKSPFPVSRYPSQKQNQISVKGSTGRGSSNVPGPSNQALVPFPSGFSKGKVMLAPKGYTVKPIIPADKAELISVAKAMHQDQFGARVKELFDPEREAALDAIRSGIYIGWRSPEYKWDCIRVGIKSKCFCGHLLAEHERFSARPEDVGEFWLRKRPNFDPRTWRAKCRCKHSHEEHDPSGSHHCTISGCPCSQFESNFLCAACDKHWEQHATFFDSEQSRKQNGLPYGEAYLPFAEMTNLRNAVLTGNEEDESEFINITEGPGAFVQRIFPSSNTDTSSSAVVANPMGTLKRQ